MVLSINSWIVSVLVYYLISIAYLIQNRKISNVELTETFFQHSKAVDKIYEKLAFWKKNDMHD